MSLKQVKKIIQVGAIAGCLLSSCLFVTAQHVKTFTDRQDILIGEQLNYKVVATWPTGVYNVQWLRLPDSLPHFEVVEKSVIDTATENGNTVLTQTITLTSFDSGRWRTPAFVINFSPIKDDTTVNLFTDSVQINVGYAPADSTNQLRDIKPILEVTVKNYLWYYIAGAVLLAIGIVLLIWFIVKKQKKKPAVSFKGKLLPYDEAMLELENLKLLKLDVPEDVKAYHTKLASIFKWYISRKQQVNYLNKTSGDVLVLLANDNLPQHTITAAAAALRMGDAVKFAKHLPLQAESTDALEKIKSTINFMHTAGHQQTVTNKPKL